MNLSKKYFAGIVLLFSLWRLNAQYNGYTFCDWNKITFNPEYIPTNNDTAIVFVSVRDYFPAKTEFMGYELDSTHKIHYFTIYFNTNKWICVPRQNLEEAFIGTKKSKDMVVYGEGMGKEFTGDLDRATRLTRTYDVLTVMFDWPTYRPYLNGGKNYRKARVQSPEVAKLMCDFFIELEKIKPVVKADSLNLTLLFHSLGNRLIKEAVTNNFINLKTKLFHHVVLNAPCVSKRGHKKWLEKLNIQDEIYLTRNNKDRTLALAKWVGFTEQLGRYWGGAKAHNAVYLNFSPVLEKEHNYFLLTGVLARYPDIKAIYSDIFHNRSINFDDEKKFIKQNHGRVITLMNPDIIDKDVNIGINIGS